jgi:hypothetical protein
MPLRIRALRPRPAPTPAPTPAPETDEERIQRLSRPVDEDTAQREFDAEMMRLMGQADR